MRNTLLALLAICATTLLSLTANAETSLRYSTHVPATHYVNQQILEPFFENVENASNGTLRFEYYPGGQLAGATAALNALKSGIADMAALQIGFTGTTLALSSIVELPGIISDYRTNADAFARLVHEDLAPVEYLPNDLYPVTVLTLPQTQLLFAKKLKKLESLDELAGLRVRVPNSVGSRTIAALGMVPVRMEIAESYTALERGTIDAVMTVGASAAAYGLQGVTQSMTTNLSLGSIGVVSAISKRSFDQLSDAQKSLLLNKGRTTEILAIEVFAKVEADARKELADAGMNLLVVPDDVLAEVAIALAGIETDWILATSEINTATEDIAKRYRSYLGQ